MRVLIVALLCALSYAQTAKIQDGGALLPERDLTEEELADVYRHVTDALKEHGLHEAAENAENEWKAIQSQSSAQRRRLTQSSSSGGRRGACQGMQRQERCVEKFDEIVKFLIEHEGNTATTICTKPSDKRQRSPIGCCGETQYGLQCGHFFGSSAHCCGATQASDGWCYADHGSFPTIQGRDVCPSNKWTCSRWGVVPGDLCAETTGDCAGEVARAWLGVADIIANALMMVFTGGAGNAAKAAATAGKNSLRTASRGVARTTMMTSIKTSLRSAGQSYMWRNLKSNLKDHFRAVPEELGNFLMEEMLAIHSVEEALELNAGDIAWDVAEIVDPTGISTFVRYIIEGPEECVYPTGPSDQDIADLNEVLETDCVGLPILTSGTCYVEFFFTYIPVNNPWACDASRGHTTCLDNRCQCQDGQYTPDNERCVNCPFTQDADVNGGCMGGIGSGRCGPMFDNTICTQSSRYCNIANGYCGSSSAHRNAQPSSTYDWKDNCESAGNPSYWLETSGGSCWTSNDRVNRLDLGSGSPQQCFEMALANPNCGTAFEVDTANNNYCACGASGTSNANCDANDDPASSSVYGFSRGSYVTCPGFSYADDTQCDCNYDCAGRAYAGDWCGCAEAWENSCCGTEVETGESSMSQVQNLESKSQSLESQSESVIAEDFNAINFAVKGFALVGVVSIFFFACKRRLGTDEYKEIDPEI